MLIFRKDKATCPRCQTKMVPSQSISGATSDFYIECPKCPTYIDTYIPLPHQSAFHQDSARYSAMFAGYGTGKTLADVKDMEKHIIITPKGETLAGAKIAPQLDATLKKDFERDLPASFVKHYNKQKNEITFINDHKLLYRPLYDEGVIRSLNLTRFTIVEASEVDHSIFVQLQTRLRNRAGMIPEIDENGDIVYDINDEGEPVMRIKHDWRKATFESNPDSGWIRDEFLLTSNRIYLHGSQIHDQEYHVPAHKADRHKATHIVPTAANPHLPPNFIEEVSMGKPEWWIRRYLKGSFDYAEGLVYPEAMRAIIVPINIKKTWKHVVAMDYGINDNTVFLFGAIDPDNHILYVYHEIVVNRLNVKDIARIYKESLNKFIPLGGLLTTPVMDQRSMSKPGSSNQVDKTLGDMFLDEGLLFKAAKMNLNARIIRTNTLIEIGQLKIFNTCTYLISEILKYKFPEKDLEGKAKSDKPVDKFNHAVNTLEFMVMELPPNLQMLQLGGLDETGSVIQAYMGERRQKMSDIYKPWEMDETYVQSDNPYYESIARGGY